MLTRIRKAQGSERAFTLIELIVVIIIIGILAAIGVAAYTQFIGTTRGEALKTTASQTERNYLSNAAFDQGKTTDPRKVTAKALTPALTELDTEGLKITQYTGPATLFGTTSGAPGTAADTTTTLTAAGVVYDKSEAPVTTVPVVDRVVALLFENDQESGCLYLNPLQNQDGVWEAGATNCGA